MKGKVVLLLLMHPLQLLMYVTVRGQRTIVLAITQILLGPYLALIYKLQIVLTIRFVL